MGFVGFLTAGRKKKEEGREAEKIGYAAGGAACSGRLVRHNRQGVYRGPLWPSIVVAWYRWVAVLMVIWNCL